MHKCKLPHRLTGLALLVSLILICSSMLAGAAPTEKPVVSKESQRSVVSPSLVFLHFDEPFGATTFYDASGNNNHGTCPGASCPIAGVAGKLNTALSFDGSGNFVEIPQAAFNDLPEGSVACWINADALDRDILYKETWVGPTISGLRTNSDGTVQGTHDNFDGGAEIVSVTPISTDRWYHVVWTWDGTSQRIYIDGELDNTQPCTDGVANDLGAWVRWGMGDRYFSGLLDEAAIYDYALSDSEVKALYYVFRVRLPLVVRSAP